MTPEKYSVLVTSRGGTNLDFSSHFTNYWMGALEVNKGGY